MSECSAQDLLNKYGGECGDFNECDDCNSEARIIPYEEFELRGSLRGGK
jgi:hypothetical protein